MKPAIIFLAGLLLAGCAQTSFRPMGSQPAHVTSPFSREVEFQVTDALFEDTPNCVIIWPSAHGASAFEDSVTGHLSTKVSRVIAPREAQRMARMGAYDISEQRDRYAFARAQRCRFELNVGTTDHASTYLLVWSQHSVLLDLSLRRIDDGILLWRARHLARRGEGGVPLSPVSVAVNTVQASVHQNDQDASLSVMDDGLRRIFRTLPDMRW